MWVHIKTVQNEDFVVTFWLDVLIFFGVTIWETEIVYVLRIPQLLHPKHPIIATWKDRIQNGRRIGKDDWTIACDTLRKCHWSQTSENLIEDEKTIIREWSLIRQNIVHIVHAHCHWKPLQFHLHSYLDKGVVAWMFLWSVDCFMGWVSFQPQYVKVLLLQRVPDGSLLFSWVNERQFAF